MDPIIKEIQEEINLLMSSKCAKFSDKQLEGFEMSEMMGKKGSAFGHMSSRPNKKPVESFDMNGNYVKTYDSVNEAADEIKVTRAAIRHVLTGRRKTCGGFIWKYKNN